MQDFSNYNNKSKKPYESRYTATQPNYINLNNQKRDQFNSKRPLPQPSQKLKGFPNTKVFKPTDEGYANTMKEYDYKNDK